jgi:hypothetical protein
LGSTTLLTRMTGNSLHMQWPLTSQLHGSERTCSENLGTWLWLRPPGPLTTLGPLTTGSSGCRRSSCRYRPPPSAWTRTCKAGRRMCLAKGLVI